MEEKQYLGVMLDCSRNAVMSVAGLKRFICALEKMGYNALQLYTEDVYELDGEAQFGYMRGKYTKDELKEIDAFAAAHGIEMMPCIQTLAHLNQLFVNPKYRALVDIDDILLVGDERTYALVEKMFQTFSECFKSRHIHIGMDEAHHLGLGEYLTKNGYRKRFDVLLEHLQRVCEIAKKYGYEPMMWSDMFFRLAFQGEYYKKGASIPEEVKKKVPENVGLAYWDYYNTDKEMIESMVDNHLSFNRKVWFFGGAWKWCGFNAANEFSFETTKPALETCVAKGVHNVFFTMWGDDGNECPAYSVLPALTYGAECYRGNYDLQNAKEKFENLFGERWEDFMALDLPMPKGIEKSHPTACGAKEMLYNDCFLGRLDGMATDEDKEGAAYRELAEKFAVATGQSRDYGYIFRSFEALCRVLSVKYSLGYKTRKAYQNGDKNGLAALILEYEKLVGLLENFLEKFRDMWNVDNKPHGFDVQEIRIGGVIARVKSCLARLKKYLGGELEKIEELEEEVLDFFTGEKPKGKMYLYNLYKSLASPNIL